MTACYHSINNLKGASVVQNNNDISIPSIQVDLLANVLNIAGFYITRNPQQFQQPQEILRKVTEAFNIISSKKPKNNNNQLKGASTNNNICSNKKKEHLKDLLNMFHS